MNFGLFYSNFLAVLEGYLHVSWTTSASDNKSPSSWTFAIGGVISWTSKKQTYISHSTMKYEFIAVVAASKNAERLRNLLLDIELWRQLMPSISLYCDGEGTLCRTFSKHTMKNLGILAQEMNMLNN